MTYALRTVVVSVAVIVAATVFATTLVHALYVSPLEDTTIAGLPSVEIPPEESPARIEIPSIRVDADVQDVGVGRSGNMAVPSNYSDVGWYRYGTVPGQTGSAVIDGHVDNGFGLPAVFNRINELQPGDSIYVVTETGRELHFVVEEIGSYAVDAVPLETLFNRADRPRLNLITCEGTWIPEKKMYDGRFVVYAVLAP